MLRVSRHELVERWALTYCQDGYRVQATAIEGYEAPQARDGVQPDLEATKQDGHVLACVIDSQEALNEPQTLDRLQALQRACQADAGLRLHVIVAAECAGDIKQFLDEGKIHAHVVHVT